jgi:hypothetical protein
VDRSLGLFLSVQQHVKERRPGWAATTFTLEGVREVARWRISESNR